MKRRLAFIHNIPSPYQVEFFNALADRPDVDVKVFYMAASRNHRPWQLPAVEKYDSHIMSGRTFHLVHPTKCYLFNPEVVQWIGTLPSDWVWVVCGTVDPTAQVAMYTALVRRLTWVLLCEAPYRHSTWWRKAAYWLLSIPVRWHSAGIIVYGDEYARRYWSNVVHDEKPVLAMPQYLNISPHLAVGQARFAQRRDYTARTVFSYSGQIEEFSGVNHLLAAFLRVASDFEHVHLRIAGEGSWRERLESREPNDLGERVVWLGGLPWEEMPSFYASSDIHVHTPYAQGWGMAVNEALAAGLPVIASEGSGAARELIDDGVNGFLVNTRDEWAIEKKLRYFAANPDAIRTLAENAYASAQELTIEKGVDRFLSYLDVILDDRHA